MVDMLIMETCFRFNYIYHFGSSRWCSRKRTATTLVLPNESGLWLLWTPQDHNTCVQGLFVNSIIEAEAAFQDGKYALLFNLSPFVPII